MTSSEIQPLNFTLDSDENSDSDSSANSNTNNGSNSDPSSDSSESVESDSSYKSNYRSGYGSSDNPSSSYTSNYRSGYGSSDNPSSSYTSGNNPITNQPDTGSTDNASDGDDIIFSIEGKGKLRGGAGADEFKFNIFDEFTKKRADKIIDFSPQEGDYLTFTHCAISELSPSEPISFSTAKTKRDLKILSKQDYDFIYYEKKGYLFWDSNGTKKNWGNSNNGGLIAILKGKPELSADDITTFALL